MKQSKGVLDDHEDNFAIVFAAMGVSMCVYVHYCVSTYMHAPMLGSATCRMLMGEFDVLCKLHSVVG